MPTNDTRHRAGDVDSRLEGFELANNANQRFIEQAWHRHKLGNITFVFSTPRGLCRQSGCLSPENHLDGHFVDDAVVLGKR